MSCVGILIMLYDEIVPRPPSEEGGDSAHINYALTSIMRIYVIQDVMIFAGLKKAVWLVWGPCAVVRRIHHILCLPRRIRAF